MRRMKSSVKFSGKILQYVADDFPRRQGEGKRATYNAILTLVDLNEVTYPPNIRQITGLNKSATQRHLNALVTDNLLTIKYARVRGENNTTIAGVYTPTLDRPKKNKNRKKQKDSL